MMLVDHHAGDRFVAQGFDDERCARHFTPILIPVLLDIQVLPYVKA